MKIDTLKIKITTFLLLFCTCISFFAQKKHPLRDVAKHYKDLGDVEKFNATLFLIKNISIHKSIETTWLTKGGQVIDFSEFSFDEYSKAQSFLKENQATPKLITKNDVNQVSVDYLIANIDAAFKFWKTKPWAKGYSFDTFCEYILPYKSGVEPLDTNWRKDWQNHFKMLLETYENETDPIAVSTSVNNSLREFQFQFQLKREDPQPLLNSSQIKYRRAGSCSDLANIAISANRAVGIATTLDFTPHFAASSNRHFWNTVITADGEHIPFNGTMGQAYTYNANYRRMGKVLRSTYSIQENSLASVLPGNKIPGLSLKNKNLMDVTDQYVDTSNITYEFIKPNENKIKFINVFNDGLWRVLWWGKATEQGKVSFKNMGRNIVYLPSQFNYTSEADPNELEPYPIVLKKNGESVVLKPDFSSTYSGILSRKNEITANNKDNNSLKFVSGEKLHLLYWDKGWQFLKTYIVENKEINIDKAPRNTLFRLILENTDNFERIFTINPKTNQMVWY